MYNKVIILGNMTRDIELKYLPNGSAIAKSSIASTHTYKTATGEKKEEVCFLEFTLFGKAAEIMNQYTHKGSKLLLEGRLVLEQWKSQDGTSRSKHRLTVEEFKFLDTKNSNPNNQNQNPQQNQYRNANDIPNQQNIPEIDINNEEIPF